MIIAGNVIAEQASGDPAACASWLSWGRNRLALFIHLYGGGPWTRNESPAPGVTVQLTMHGGGAGLIRVQAGGGPHGFVFRPVDLDDSIYGWGNPYTSDNRPLGSPLQSYYGAAKGEATESSGRGPYNILEVEYAGDAPKYTRHHGRPSFDQRVVNVGDLDWPWVAPSGKLRGYLTWGSPSTGRGVTFPAFLNFDGGYVSGAGYYGNAGGFSASTAGMFPYCMLRPGSRIDWTGGYGFSYAGQVGAEPEDPPRLTGFDRMRYGDGGIEFISASIRRTTKVFLNGGVFFDFQSRYVMGAAIGVVQGDQCLLAVVAGSKYQGGALELVAVKLSERKQGVSAARTLASFTPPEHYSYGLSNNLSVVPGTWSCNFFFNASGTECSAIVPMVYTEPSNNLRWECHPMVQFKAIASGAPTTAFDDKSYVLTTRNSTGSTWSGTIVFACDYKGDELVTATATLSGSSTSVNGSAPTLVVDDETGDATWAPGGPFTSSISATETITACGETFSLSFDYSTSFRHVKVVPPGGFWFDAYNAVETLSESWGANKGAVFLFADLRDDYLIHVDVSGGAGGTLTAAVKDSSGETFHTYSQATHDIYGILLANGGPRGALPPITERTYPQALTKHCTFPVALDLDLRAAGLGVRSVSLLTMPASQRLVTGDRLTSIEILPAGNSIDGAQPNTVGAGNTTYAGAKYITRLYRKDGAAENPWAHIPLAGEHRALFDLGVM